jgi:NAD(P)-dependent dehydrogenase (short-subunit alcohol dehydrogenase family)
MRLKDKVAIVTGGGGKIGKHYALGLAKEGAKVCLADLMDASAAAREVEAMGGKAISLTCDVSEEKSVQAMVETVVERFGGVDILVNNAAYFTSLKRGPLWEMEVEEFDRAMAVNARGVWLCTKAVFASMKDRRGGKIINIASGSPLIGNPNYIHYVASKGAVIAMTRAMARELGAYGICVNTLAPGLVMTEGRKYDREHAKKISDQRSIKRDQVESDLVGTVVFLASSESDFMTGQLLVVDGGQYFL